MSQSEPKVTVICGGVGAARFLLGLRDIVPAGSITAVVNVADDIELHGLWISPDLDTITYTLANETDPKRGWGLRDESWKAMNTLAKFGDADWFSLGDRDIGTHLHRTRRLNEGATLTEVAGELARGWGVATTVLPVTDDRVSTIVTLADEGSEVGFQEYFVRRQHGVPISAVRFDGISDARATEATIEAIEAADVLIIAPSNPIVSIAPVMEVPGVAAAVRSRTTPTVAVSPIVGGAALKGPAAAMLAELGHEASAVGVARLLAGLGAEPIGEVWSERPVPEGHQSGRNLRGVPVPSLSYRLSPIVDVLVIDDVDAHLASAVAKTGVTPVVANTLMSDRDLSARLARITLGAASLGVFNR